MNLIWVTKLLLLVQLVNVNDDSLTIFHKGSKVIAANRAEFTVPLPDLPVIDQDKYIHFVEKVDRQIYKPPENATINNQGMIVPEHVGYKLDRQAFTNQFYTYFFGNGASKIEVPTYSVHPKVDSELLSNIRIQQIGRYVTYFNSNNKNRSHNISLAVKSINNSVVFPGEIFSFNKAVGNRTASKGYQRAPVIVKGEFSEGIGGGICQVSSTLYNAADGAGMKIVERFTHSKHVPYVPSGRDATVSWYGPDFQFKNNCNQPTLIRARALEGTVIIELYSSDGINNQPRKIAQAPIMKINDETPHNRSVDKN
jgi:vancomycin resistance protein YoaR